MSVRRKRRLPAVALTTSMGDIAFLLIIFFVLAGIQRQEKKFAPPEAPRLDELKRRGAVTVTLDRDGKCSVNDEEGVPLDGLAERIRELLAKTREKTVIVEIDRNQKPEAYQKVMLAVGEAGGTMGAVGIEPSR